MKIRKSRTEVKTILSGEQALRKLLKDCPWVVTDRSNAVFHRAILPNSLGVSEELYDQVLEEHVRALEAA